MVTFLVILFLSPAVILPLCQPRDREHLTQQPQVRTQWYEGLTEDEYRERARAKVKIVNDERWAAVVLVGGLALVIALRTFA